MKNSRWIQKEAEGAEQEDTLLDAGYNDSSSSFLHFKKHGEIKLNNGYGEEVLSGCRKGDGLWVVQNNDGHVMIVLPKKMYDLADDLKPYLV